MTNMRVMCRMRIALHMTDMYTQCKGPMLVQPLLHKIYSMYSIMHSFTEHCHDSLPNSNNFTLTCGYMFVNKFLNPSISEDYRIFTDLCGMAAYVLPTSEVPDLTDDLRKKLCLSEGNLW